MLFNFDIITLIDFILFIVCLFILMGSIFISFRTGFVQLRFIPFLFKMLVNSIFYGKERKGNQTVLPHRALFTAMSTTLGISTIVSPIIAISLGGPGALLGYLFTSFFGSAATYVEVNLSIRYRKKSSSGELMGGPMQYLKDLFSPAVAKWYAICCFILMAAWSGAQSNQLAAILNSPLLEPYSLSTTLSGGIIATLVILTLIGGIKLISALSARIVPAMFILYLGSCLWILFVNIDKLWPICQEIIQSAYSPYALGSGVFVGGIVASLRWGIFKGVQTCEAGVGTQAIPHSMAHTDDPAAQGALAMLSTYTAGFMAFLSGFVALITETWLDPNLPLGITMVAASFQYYFSFIGIVIVVISAFLFAFGTILGNSFNGGQCFHYLTNNKKQTLYLIFTAIMIFIGAVSEAKTIWSLIDIVLACVAIPHMSALIVYAYKNPKAISAPSTLNLPIFADGGGFN